jgi:hypothetical protein
MSRIKLVLPALCFLALPAFAILRQDSAFGQDKKPEKPVANGTSARVPFGTLTYTEPGAPPVSVSAKSLIEVRLIQAPYEGLRVELLFQNGDYSLIKPASFQVQRKTDGNSYEVLVTRTDPSGMAFPFVN